MKLLLTTTFAAVLVFWAQAATNRDVLDELEADARQVIETCGKENNAEEQDIKDLHAFKVPTSHEAKCTLACFYKHYSVMTKDGVFDKEATKSFLEVLEALDTDLHSKMMKVMKNCENAESFQDHCETALSMYSCIAAESKKLGVFEDDLMTGA